MSDRLLELQLELLLLRHGRRAVIDALGAAGRMTREELEAAIAATERRNRKKSVPPTPEAVAKKEFAAREDALPVVQQLLTAYETRTFLPNLRDVQRFVERAGVMRGRLKSRASATSALVKALATLSDADLRQLVANGAPIGSNDFEVLAHEIMGGTMRTKRPKHD